jgi:hypothetical protein
MRAILSVIEDRWGELVDADWAGEDMDFGDLPVPNRETQVPA